MRFQETSLPGAYVIEIDELRDARGFFARSFCAREFAARGLEASVAQCNISYNAKKGTLRGLHYQEPASEAKLVRAVAGSLFDVIVDLRPASPAYLRHETVVLAAAKRNQLFVPKGFAHGFQTLEDGTEVFYQMSEFYAAGQDRGLRWDDPVFGIRWPLAVSVISERDQSYPDWKP